MLVDDLRAWLADELASSGPSSSTAAATTTAKRFADAPLPPPMRSAPPVYRGWNQVIQSVTSPWVYQLFPVGQIIPAGWIAAPNISPAALRGGRSAAVAGATSVLPYAPRFQGLVRQSAEAAATNAAIRRLREQERDQRRAAALEKLSKRVVFGVDGGRTPRPPRAPRRPRPPRQPRRPRQPRIPRVPGTKDQRKQSPCKKRNSLGQCVKPGGCTPSATIPEPGHGHSSCNWGPVDSCGNCVQQGCIGPAASLLKPFLKLLPKYWTEQSVTLFQQEQQAMKQSKRGAVTFARLPKLSGASGPVSTGPRIIDPRALVAGCACQDWPGWVICPNCSGGPACICRGACIAFPANTANCAR
jgi:hypothetical protein